jgi:integrase/recombinase XerD
MAHELATVETASPSILTAAEFHRLADVPPEAEWFANIQNKHTRDAYKRDVSSFMRFVGIRKPEDFRTITRAHVIAWRGTLGHKAAASVRRQLSALSSLMDYLCDQNAIAHNPVNGVDRPTEGANEGKTPAISDAQARRLLETPPPDTLKGKRDRAIIAILLYHGLRRSELSLCALKTCRSAAVCFRLWCAVNGERFDICPCIPWPRR